MGGTATVLKIFQVCNTMCEFAEFNHVCCLARDKCRIKDLAKGRPKGVKFNHPLVCRVTV